MEEKVRKQEERRCTARTLRASYTKWDCASRLGTVPPCTSDTDATAMSRTSAAIWSRPAKQFIPPGPTEETKFDFEACVSFCSFLLHRFGRR